jgi:hypothetical protein
MLRPTIENIFGPSRHPQHSDSAGAQAETTVDASGRSTPIKTPHLDALPRSPILFESCAHLSVLFVKSRLYFSDKGLIIDESVFSALESNLAESIGSDKPISSLPSGWNLIFGTSSDFSNISYRKGVLNRANGSFNLSSDRYSSSFSSQSYFCSPFYG